MKHLKFLALILVAGAAHAQVDLPQMNCNAVANIAQAMANAREVGVTRTDARNMLAKALAENDSDEFTTVFAFGMLDNAYKGRAEPADVARDRVYKKCLEGNHASAL